MVVTVGAINKKDVNNLYKDSEKTGGEKANRSDPCHPPVVIVDEPQSVDGGSAGTGTRSAGSDESALHPALFCDARRPAPHGLPARCRGRLRAQAREADRGGLRHDRGCSQQAIRAVDIHEQQGAGRSAPGSNSTWSRRAAFSRQDEDRHGRRRSRTDHRPRRLPGLPYRRHSRRTRGTNSSNFGCRATHAYLLPGESWGDVDASAVAREMIRRTIREHLDKEKRLRPQGIKVLSLFFIDIVDRYRRYDEGRLPQSRASTPASSRRSTRAWRDIRTTTRSSRRSMSPLARPRKSTTATSPSTRRAVGRTPPKTTRSESGQRRARLQPHHAGEGEAPEPRHAAQVHIFPLGPARGLGQPQRVPDLRAPRHPDRDSSGGRP